MPLNLDWTDIALRLALTLVACGILGLERGEADRAAGMRTILLVALAACFAMIEANMLMSTTVKPDAFFTTFDVMRLPLGILTGVGFIGAGAILRRDDRIIGLTTAATLWFVTVIGICFGGGQLILGGAASVLGFFILHILKILERHLPRARVLRLHIAWQLEQMSEAELRAKLEQAGLRIAEWRFSHDLTTQRAELQSTLHWRARPGLYDVPASLREIVRQPGITKVDWAL